MYVYLAVGDSSRGLLLAEALHRLRGHFGRLWLVRARWWWEVRAVDVHGQAVGVVRNWQAIRKIVCGCTRRYVVRR